MKRHAYLIMAHNNIYTLETLVRLLDDKSADIYIHVDKKWTDFVKEKIIEAANQSRISFIKERIDVQWGTQSQIKTELLLFEEACHNGPYGYYHLLSGNDLPIKNKEYIKQFFENTQSNYLLCESELTIYDYQRLSLYREVFGHHTRWNNYAYLLQHRFKTDRLTALKKRYPIIKKGWNWCDLTEDAVQEILSKKKDILRFTRFSMCADEMYKQIILSNAHLPIHPIVKALNMKSDGVRYIVWEGGNHPRTLLSQDIDWMLKSPFLFARKFDEKVDKKAISQLYNRLKSED